jgi:hypothetical protein
VSRVFFRIRKKRVFLERMLIGYFWYSFITIWYKKNYIAGGVQFFIKLKLKFVEIDCIGTL